MTFLTDNYYTLGSSGISGEYEEHVREKMKEQRQGAIYFIGKLVRQDLAEDFAEILASAYENNCEAAEKIANAFGLDQLDFLAILGNYRQFLQKFCEKECDYE